MTIHMAAGLVYFIDGTRGAGKVHLFAKCLSCAGNDKAELSVSPLAYVDPSRIERSEIILLSILKELKNRITHARVGSSYDGDDLLERFREQFKN